MSEAWDAKRRRVLHGFAAAYLMAAGYTESYVQGLGDLSEISDERVWELLAVKAQERKRALAWAKKRRVGLLPGGRRKLRASRRVRKSRAPRKR